MRFRQLQATISFYHCSLGPRNKLIRRRNALFCPAFPEVSHQQGQTGCQPSQNHTQNASHSQTSGTIKRQLGLKSLSLWTKYLSVSSSSATESFGLYRSVVSRGILSPTMRSWGSMRKHFPSLKYSTQACPSP